MWEGLMDLKMHCLAIPINLFIHLLQLHHFASTKETKKCKFSHRLELLFWVWCLSCLCYTLWAKRVVNNSNFLYSSYRKVCLALRHSRKILLCTPLRWRTMHAVPAREVFQVSLGKRVTDSLKVWEAGQITKGRLFRISRVSGENLDGAE